MRSRTTTTFASLARVVLGVTLCVSAVAGCADSELSPLAPGQPQFAISDGAHNGGNSHFYFLPPLVKNPHSNGVFDAGLSPIIEIVDRDLMSVIGTLDANLDNSNSHYHQNWHTNDYNLDPSHTYRLRILVDGVELGYADVDVAANGSELKNIDTDEFIALKDGRTLPIMFRIEDGALSSDPGTVKVTTTLADGSDTPDGSLGFSVCDMATGTVCDPDGATVPIVGMESFSVLPGSYQYTAEYIPGASEDECSIVEGGGDDETGPVDVFENVTTELSFEINCGGF